MSDLPSSPSHADQQPSVQQTNTSGHNAHIDGDSNEVIIGDKIVQNYSAPKIRSVTCPAAVMPKAVICGGRDDELTQIMTSLQQKRPVAITALHGMGGMGKTTLATYLAHHVIATKTFATVIWVDVRKKRDLGLVLKKLSTYGDSTYQQDATAPLTDLADEARANLTHALQEACHCQPHEALMILDDVWDKEAAQILYRAAPNQTTVLITTRSHEMRSWLTEHNPATIRLGYLEPENAVAMLREYIPNEDKSALQALGDSLGGHPLAMRLAVSRLTNEMEYSDETQAAVLARHTRQYREDLPVTASFAAVELETPDAQDDDSTSPFETHLSKSFSYSYETLSPEEQSRFRALGVLADAPVTAAYLAALWQLAPDEVGKVGAAPLIKRSLLEKTSTGYRLHGLLRIYARSLLRTAGEEEAVFNRYAAHMTTVGEQFDELPLEDWGQLDADLPHIDEVGNRLTTTYTQAGEMVSDELAQRVGDFVWAVMRYLGNRPVMIETKDGREWRGLRWLTAGLRAYQQLKQARREDSVLHNIGKIWSDLGNKQQALAYYEKSLVLSRAADDKRGEATTLNNIGAVWSDLGDKHKALAFYDQVLPLMQAVSDKRSEATALNNIGGVWSDLGDKHKALAFFEQALPLRRDVGDKGGEATTLSNIGGVWDDLGDKHKALAFYDQALPLRRAVGDKSGEATTLSNIGKVWSALDDKQQALAFYDQALPLLRAVGNRSVEAATLTNIGKVWSDLGDKHKALAFYDQALPLRRAVGDKGGEAATLTNIGKVWSDLGDKHKALAFYDQALPLMQAVGDKRGEATTLSNIGAVWSALGDKHKALAFFEQALPLRRAVGDKGGEAVTCFNMGMVYEDLGDLDRAIEFVERCVLLKEQVQHPGLASNRQTLEELKQERDGG